MDILCIVFCHTINLTDSLRAKLLLFDIKVLINQFVLKKL